MDVSDKNLLAKTRLLVHAASAEKGMATDALVLLRVALTLGVSVGQKNYATKKVATSPIFKVLFSLAHGRHTLATHCYGLIIRHALGAEGKRKAVGARDGLSCLAG